MILLKQHLINGQIASVAGTLPRNDSKVAHGKRQVSEKLLFSGQLDYRKLGQ
jgi:hypothetical protein